MTNRLISFWIELRASLWFVPGLMIAASIVLALVLVEVDSTIGNDWTSRYPLLFGVGVDGSRGMLTAIASSMLTVAALVFSLTLNAVNQASGQFTPRIFRNFLRDRANQFVLGYFVSIFAYCLIVLRTIRSGDEAIFVPSIAVVTGLVMAIGGILVLIFFINHIAASLQISNIIGEIVDETKKSISTLFPDDLGKPAAEDDDEIDDRLDDAQRDWVKVPSSRSGYVKLVDIDDLAEFAANNACVVRMEVAVGSFVGTGSRIVSVLPLDDKEFDDDKIEELNDLFVVSRDRTIEQDIGFGLRQLVDIALKALSPAINDSTTALSCIDYLTAILISMAKRPSRPPLFFCKDELRLIVNQQRFEDYFDLAFNQIRQNAAGNVAVILRLLNSMEVLGKGNQTFNVQDERLERHELLETQTRLLYELAKKTIKADADLQTVARHYKHVSETLEGLR